jgi:2-oxoglutarate dehydrogenase E2 component (dihydrolipoamide succinyltransferase)
VKLVRAAYPKARLPPSEFFEAGEGTHRMSRVDVIMPQMGESIAEGTVSKWLKKVGDEVKRDEAILEISTDKVDAEIPSPASGILAEIKVEQGKTVPIQTVIAVIETEKSAAAELPKPAAPAAPAAAPPPSAPAPNPAPAPQRASAPAAASAAPPPPQPAPQGDGSPETGEERLRRKSTPLVRKIAAEHNVDISRLSGTGIAGRVTKKDILGYIETGPAPAPASEAPRAPAAPMAGAVAHPTVEAWPGDRVEPMSKIRKLTADHMVMSRRVSAHVTSFFEIDYTRIAKLRQAKKGEFESRGAKLTYLAFITKAVADNLRRHPVVNASVSGDSVIYRKPINVGIAVALDWGLIVPVLKNADELSVFGIAKKLADLADRARSKRLSPDEVQQGTFTITNPGVFGSYIGTPIISQPQVAILGVGTVEKRPKVITLDDGQDVIAIRTMGMLSMSYDHRVVDGADGDRFLADVKKTLESFPEGAL